MLAVIPGWAELGVQGAFLVFAVGVMAGIWSRWGFIGLGIGVAGIWCHMTLFWVLGIWLFVAFGWCWCV